MFEINSLLLDLTRSKSTIYVLNGLLLSFLALSVVYWSSFYMNQKYAVLLGNSQSSEPSRSVVGFNVDELISDHIFGAPNAQPSLLPNNIPLSSLNLKLTGVIASDRGGFALISVNGQPQAPFFIGEVVVENALLDAVLPDRAILLRGGIKESLLLDSDNKQVPAIQLRPGIPSPDPALGSDSIKNIGGNRFQVSRSEVTANVNNPDFLRQALIVPNPQGGFAVKNIQPGSVIEKLGLRKGDVIRKVNNLQINSMVDVMQLYRLTNDINQVSRVKIEVTRNGQQQILQYNLH